MGFDLPIKLKDGIYWIGCDESVLLNSNVYLIKDGKTGVLIDPAVTQKECIYQKASKVMDLEDIKYVVIQNYEPDTINALEDLKERIGEFTIVTHWKIASFLKKFDLGVPFYIVDENGWKLRLEEKELDFIFAPFNYFCGSFCSFESESKALFSAELFSSLKNKFSLFVNKEPVDLLAIKNFHKIYMPAEFVKKTISTLPECEMILPKYGSVLEGEFIEKVKKELLALEREDYDLLREKIMNELYKDLAHYDFKESFNRLYKNLSAAIKGLSQITFRVNEEFLGAGRLDFTRKLSKIEMIEQNEVELGFFVDGHLSEKEEIFLNVMLDKLILPLANNYLKEKLANKNRFEKNPVIDSLTGLFSSDYLEFLRPKLQQSKRYGFDIIFANLVVEFPDKISNLYKECILREVAKTLQSRFRSSDVLIRLDSGRFLIVMPFTSFEDGYKKMKAIFNELSDKNFCGTKNLKVDVQMQIQQYDKESSLEEMLKKLNSSKTEIKQPSF